MKIMTVIAAVLMLQACSPEKEPPPDVASSKRRFPVPVITGEPSVSIANPLGGTSLPILAVWAEEEPPSPIVLRNHPHLRVALWADGTIVFARDPNVWGHDLMIGQVPEEAIVRLKQSLRDAGVFELREHSYLVPDASVYCTMLAFGGDRQMLYWDEVEQDGYGINIDPKPHDLTFKKVWWEVNRLALSILPGRAKKLDAQFQDPPKTWYLE